MGDDSSQHPAVGTSHRLSARVGAAVFFWAAAVVAGCHSHGSGPQKDGGLDGSADGGPAVVCSNTNGMRRTNGVACGCNGDCASGFCVDGLCCNTACTETCKSCNTPTSPGLCGFVPAGALPRLASTCPASDMSSCGLDGTCNGNGACRSYEAGTVCAPGTCDGAAVKNIRVCDGQGTCTSGPATICAPFGCDSKTGACVITCASDNDCAGGIKCVGGSCGPKPIGAVCTAASQCASKFCADGFCCNVACSGACVSCSQSGRIGTCWPISAGNDDPHLICKASASATCGQTGRCDGIGGCAKYAAETICLAPSCNGDRLNTAGTCDGLGTCRPQGVQTCDPYQCIDGACVGRCTDNTDCVSGHTCVGGSCGPKSNGQACTTASQCASNFCVDGVCCADACQGACHSCSLASSLGTCTPSPATATDPHGMCVDKHAASCATDGTCDGAGACHKYARGTTCAGEQCTGGVYTAASACDANGNCMAPDALPCAPYVCNGTRCFSGCTDGTDCSSGNVCTNNSCGLKPNGAFCSTKSECQSANCAQGVCCVSACASACQSCALTGMMGTCTAVPPGMPDPTESCLDQGGPSCGTNGKCQAGSCQKYVQGTPCAGASCPAAGTTFTPASSCDGAGACVTPMSTSCAPFGCGANACKTSCTADADCKSPASCNSGSCGLKPPGAVCGSGPECGTGICAQGACCLTACASKCMSCALTASAGTCTPIAANRTDPTGQCTDQGASSCKNTGFCDGNGGCQFYAAGTQCAGPSCPSGTTTASLPQSCDGAGNCKPATTQSCAPFACNGTTCIAVCTANADCAPGNVCNNGACGLRRLGQLCNAGTDCDSGNCIDGVCCSAASCGTCRACNVAGQAGSCQPTPPGGSEPHGGCTPNPPCGFDGTCDGSGACRNQPTTTSCGTGSCSGSSYTPVGTCDGAGSCAQTPVSCGHYTCGSGVCLTMCSGNGDCTGSGYTCQSSSCTNLKPLGTACVMGTECLSNLCTDGVCCSTGPSCGSCNSCALNGHGTCSAVAAGGSDPAAICMDTGASSCGTTGVCDGAGNCASYPSGGTCAPASCPDGMSLTTSVCAAGLCKPSTVNCAPFACDVANSACKTMCTADTDCASGSTCSGSPGSPGTCQ